MSGSARDVYHDDQPAWSPDGTTLVFQRSGNALFGDLFLVDLMTGVARPLTPYAGPIPGIQLNPVWSPDGRMIAFASRHETEAYQIYTIWADGTRLARRTDEVIDLLDPEWLVQ
jgi:Tol biopolymer transport system component